MKKFFYSIDWECVLVFFLSILFIALGVGFAMFAKFVFVPVMGFGWSLVITAVLYILLIFGFLDIMIRI